MTIDDIIKNVHNYNELIHFSFREIYLLFNDYWLDISPFTYCVYKYPKVFIDEPEYRAGYYFDKMNLDYFGHRPPKQFHHQDYRGNSSEKILYDPCDIYEQISGVYIHTKDEMEYDIHNEEQTKHWNNIYKRDVKYFKEYCLNRERINKLNRII